MSSSDRSPILSPSGERQSGTFRLLDAMTGPFLSKIRPEPLDDPRDAEIARLREANAVLTADVAMALDALRELVPFAAHASEVLAAIEGEPLVGVRRVTDEGQALFLAANPEVGGEARERDGINASHRLVGDDTHRDGVTELRRPRQLVGVRASVFPTPLKVPGKCHDSTVALNLTVDKD